MAYRLSIPQVPTVEEIWKFITELQIGSQIEFKRTKEGKWIVTSSDGVLQLVGEGDTLTEAYFNV